MPYRLFVHEDYHPPSEVPLVLCLHGAGGRGTDNARHLNDGGNMNRFWMNEVCIIVSPQQNNYWGYDEIQLAHEIVLSVCSSHFADRSRLYVTGMSQGGNGTWRALSVYTNTYAAGGPICGWGDRWIDATEGPPDYGGNTSQWAARLTRTPIWAWHGASDNTVPYNNSAFMVDKIKQHIIDGGGAVDTNVLKLTRLEGVGHAAWNHSYVSQEFKNWLFSQRSGTGSSMPPAYLGNAVTGDGQVDDLKANLVINEGDAYLNATGSRQELRVGRFRFDASRVGGIATPFLARVNGDNDFTVLEIGTTRVSTNDGENVFAFSAQPTPITLMPGEKIAAGFMDTEADGEGGNGALVRFDTAAPVDEIWRTGGNLGRFDPGGSVTEGQAPQPGGKVFTNEERNYHFGLTLETIDGDGDRMNDGWEIRYFGGITNSAGNVTDDWDGDGFIDLHEFLAATDPTNGASLMAFTGAAETGTNGLFALRWQAVTGKTYRVLSRGSLGQGTWDTNAVGIEGVSPECVHTVSVDSAEAFFRVELE